MKFCMFFAVFCLFGYVSGQDLKKDISTMNYRLDKLADYRIDVDYSAGDTADFFNQGMASVIVSEKGMFYQTDFASMLINEKNTIIINEEDKTLIYSDNVQAEKDGTPLENYILQGIDTLLLTADSVYFSHIGDKRVYYLRFTQSYFDLVELTFGDVFLTKVVYYYNEEISGEKGLTAVCNIFIEEHPVYNKDLLQTEFYLIEENNTVVPTELFTGYVLVYNESIESIESISN